MTAKECITDVPFNPPSSRLKQNFLVILCTIVSQQNVRYIQTVCVIVGGGGMLNCAVDHILQEFYSLFLTRFRTYKIATPPKTKMTSKDNIKGFVSLKFLRLWG